MTAYEGLLISKQPIRAGQPGFAELASIVRGSLSGTGQIEIAELAIPDHAWSVLSTDKGMESAATITLRVTLADGRSAEQGAIKDLRPEIRQRYLQSRLFAWGATIFWVGVVVTTISLVMLTYESRQTKA